ncbi:MAG TPA: CoA transferase [Casimicrobiaceae bacterium]|nr:CoA transferase [Casimicrobiaceae bacterium]
MSRDLGISPETLETVDFAGSGDLPSVFAVSDFAASAVATASAALAELISAKLGSLPRVTVERRLSSLWFGWSLRPEGWERPSIWDPIAGDYPAADGWIRLHTNAPHHRAAALSVLGVPGEKTQVARAVAGWEAEALEAAVVRSNGCAAAMRTMAAWATHAQGESVSREPLVIARATDDASDARWCPAPDRPLRGIRVLDLTRVLAGPVATRFLAGFGADVLRIDPPSWDEPGVIPDVTLGKRCARLDLHNADERAIFVELLRRADVLVHGYRADALEKIGLDAGARRTIHPGLVDVSLNAYGWSGPWRNRRGFDSLVQMSAGIAEAGMRLLGKDRPSPLPVQALDHATGYLIAAAAIRGLAQRTSTARGFEARTSLARTTQLLVSEPAGKATGQFAPATDDEYSEAIEATGFGPARRLRPPVAIAGAPMRWDRPAAKLGSSAPAW